MNIIFLYSIISFYIIAIITAAHALLNKQQSQAAFAWIAVILSLPIGGTILYWLFGIRRIDSLANALMEKVATKAFSGVKSLHSVFLIKTPKGFIHHLKLPTALAKLSTPGMIITDRYLIEGNSVRPLYNGEQAYPEMLKAIGNATKRVYLSTYIFSNDSVGKQFLNALNQAASRGCEVKVILDGIGSFFPLTGWKKQFHHTIELAYFLPPRLYPPQISINLRTHRKILVCDNTIGFIGGMNISQHHLVNLDRPDRVQDIHFSYTGPIIGQLEAAFIMDWCFVTGGKVLLPSQEQIKPSGSTYTRLVVDGPGSPDKQINTICALFCSMISSAKKNIRIMTPYFLPVTSLTEALASAVNRGIHVDIIIPIKSNNFIFQWAMLHQLPRIIERNIPIYFQPEPFAHTKLLLIDEEYSLIGSSNLDPRSLNLNFEVVMENFDKNLNEKLTIFFDAIKLRSKKITTNIKDFPLILRLRNAITWLFSPYL